MVRPLRIEYEGAVYHVTARGNERGVIFKDDKDFEKFLAVIEENLERHGVRLFCFALMNNHYHLLFETPGANLSVFMHGIQSHYTGYYNRRHGRVGHLFQGRYKALVVQKETYLLELSRYIHLNPVRAGLVDSPGEWRWSSYKDYMSSRGHRKWIDTEDVLCCCGSIRTNARKKYRRLVESVNDEFTDVIKDDVKAQLILGNEDFVEKIKGFLKMGEPASFADIVSGRQLMRWDSKDAESALEVVAKYYGVEPETLIKKGQNNNFPRDVAISVFFRHSRWAVHEIGAEFGVSYSAVSKAVGRVNDKMLSNMKVRSEINNIFLQFMD